MYVQQSHSSTATLFFFFSYDLGFSMSERVAVGEYGFLFPEHFFSPNLIINALHYQLLNTLTAHGKHDRERSKGHGTQDYP